MLSGLSGAITETDNCQGNTIAPQATCTITVTYAPTTSLATSKTLSLAYNNGVSAATPLTEALSGIANPQALLSLSEASYGFGNKAVNGTYTHTITVTNDASVGSASASSITLSGLSGIYSQTNNCGSLAPQASCTITVTYAPVATGATSQTLSVAYYDGASNATPETDSLSGTGIGDAVLSLGESSYSYGNKALNGSYTHTITVTNTAPSGSAGASSIVLSGLSGVISETDNCAGNTIAAQATCTITVTYAPVATVATNQTLTLAYNNGVAAATLLTDAVSGTGIGDAVLSLSEASYDFGNKALNGSYTHTITVTNTAASGSSGASSIVLSGLSGVMSETDNCAGNTIAAQTTCTITVTYAPTATVVTNQTLSLAYNNGATAAASITDALTGTGINDAVLSLSEASYGFGNQAVNGSFTHTITVTNTAANGSSPASSIVISGLSGVMSETDNCQGNSIAAQATCTITVTYAPTVTQVTSQTLSLAYNNGAAAATTLTDSITGTGISDAVLSLSESSYGFGNKAVNGSYTHTITVTNTAAVGSATASSIAISGLSSIFSESDNCASIAPQATCTIIVTYAPTVTGSNSQTLTLNYNNGATAATPLTDVLSGAGIGDAVLSLGESSYGYGNQATGGSYTHLIVVTNTAAVGSASASSITLSGLSGVMTQTNTCGSLAPQASCTITVTYAPVAQAITNQTLTVSYGNGTGGTSSVTDALSGTAVTIAVLSLSEASYDFGNQVNTGSYTHTITVTNTAAVGSASASSISLSGLSGVMSQTNTCSGTVAPQATCSITVTYAPISAVTTSQTLSLAYNNGVTSATPVTDAISGTGVNVAVLSLSEASYDFGNKAVTGSYTHTITVTNTAALGSASASSISLSGLSGVMSQTNTCSGTVAPQATCSITVTYAPVATVATSQTLSVAWNNGAASDTALTDALTGTGINKAVLSLGESSYGFNSQVVNQTLTHTITVTNTAANGSATATGISLSGLSAPMTQTNNCGSLAPQATCAITVTYAPTSVGATSETLSVDYNNGAAAATALTDALTGTGIAAQLISVGNDSACAVVSGNVYCWGSNAAKQLGNNSTTASNVPVEVYAVGGVGNGYLSNIVSVQVNDTGSTTACAVSSLASGGNVYCWGYGTSGNLGNNSTTASQGTPVEVLDTSGSAGNYLSNIVAITGSYVGTVCALNSTGSVYCWGGGRQRPNW